MAQMIRNDYAATTIHLLCVLKGGSAFFEDLCQQVSPFITRCHSNAKKDNIVRIVLTYFLGNQYPPRARPHFAP
jgi:hypothetical protein